MPGPCPLGCALVCPTSAATRSWAANPVGPATSFARGMLWVAGVGLGIDGLDQAVYRVPDTLLDLWAFVPDGVQVQLDGASIWSEAGDLQFAVVVVGSFRAPFDAPLVTMDPHPRLAGLRSPVDLRLYVDLVAAFRLGGRHRRQVAREIADGGEVVEDPLSGESG